MVLKCGSTILLPMAEVVVLLYGAGRVPAFLLLSPAGYPGVLQG